MRFYFNLNAILYVRLLPGHRVEGRRRFDQFISLQNIFKL